MKKLIWLIIILCLGLVACGGSNSNGGATEDAEILSGVGDMPKALATVWISPTPAEVLGSPTPVPFTATPTLTTEPPEATYTPTAVVGTYLGDVDDNGTPIVRNYPPPDLPVFLAAPDVPGVVVVPPSGGNGGGEVIINGGFNPEDCDKSIIDQSFINAYNQNTSVAQTLGCPLNGGEGAFLVQQSFERGELIWRSNGIIYAFPSTGTYYAIPDIWTDGIPETDPNLVPPDGLIQPIRGFGLAWRSNDILKNALGWAINGENQYPSYIQEFQGGYMVIGGNEKVYAVVPNQSRFYGPFSK